MKSDIFEMKQKVVEKNKVSFIVIIVVFSSKKLIVRIEIFLRFMIEPSSVILLETPSI